MARPIMAAPQLWTIPMIYRLILGLSLTFTHPATADSLQAIHITGSELVIHDSNDRALRGNALIGAVLTMSVEGGRAAELRINAVSADPYSKFDDVLLYDLSVKDAAGVWGPACGLDPYGKRDAILQPAPDGTLAIWCTGGTHAKCIRDGYRPWAKGPQGHELAPYHLACTKMLRADYCGNDQATTRTGMLVDIYDKIGINTAEGSTVPGVTFEAAFGTEGAVCVAHPRVPQNISLDLLGQTCPRLQTRLGSVCTPETASGFGRVLLYLGSRGDGIIESERPNHAVVSAQP